MENFISKMVLLSIEYSYIRNVDLSVIKEITCSVLNKTQISLSIPLYLEQIILIHFPSISGISIAVYSYVVIV